MLARSVAFDFRDAAPALAQIPQKPGVFALFAADSTAEPYLSRTTNLRRRIARFLDARPTQTRRLQLAEKVARIEYTATGSDLESTLVLYSASLQAFGERARRRLRLSPPSFIRMAAQNPYPRAYVTAKLARNAASHLYGPFPSRLAAERYLDEALNLFLLRRCTFELNPDPVFPGCVYSEMKMCLAPCFKGCTDERYAQEAARVEAFLATGGASLIEALAAERDAASDAMEFEQAAALHARIQKVQAVAALAAEVVRPLSHLNGILLMPAAESFHVALFSLERGMLSGPALYSVAGMRHPNEQAGSTSLFAHPVALEPVPLIEAMIEPAPQAGPPAGTALEGVSTSAPTATRKAPSPPRGMLEARLDAALASIAATKPRNPDAQTVSDHLCMFKRWYYRPAGQRVGEIVFCGPDAAVPAKAVIRAISRVFRGARVADSGAPQGNPVAIPDAIGSPIVP